jgi:hypothetical protein
LTNSDEVNFQPYRDTGIYIKEHFCGKSKKHERKSEKEQSFMVVVLELKNKKNEEINLNILSDAIKYAMEKGLKKISHVQENQKSKKITSFLDDTDQIKLLALATIDAKVLMNIYISKNIYIYLTGYRQWGPLSTHLYIYIYIYT